MYTDQKLKLESKHLQRTTFYCALLNWNHTRQRSCLHYSADIRSVISQIINSHIHNHTLVLFYTVLTGKE